MFRHRRFILGLALAASTFLLTGCAGLSGLDRPPRVTLVTIEPVQIQLLEQRFLATIRIQNPNPVELPIDGLEYAIRINDSKFADGVSSQRVTVPAFGEKTLQVSVTSTLVSLFDQLRRFGDSKGAISYGITGTLGVTGIPGGVPFEHDGEIDLRPGAPAGGRSV